MVPRGRFFVTGALIVHTCWAFAAPRKGFGIAKKTKRPTPTADDKIAEKTARSLFGVCSHLQDPELYSPVWVNVCKLQDDGVVAAQNIERGDIISFYPVHSVGLRGNKEVKGRRRTDYLVYNSDRDGNFFGSKRRTTKYCIDFPAMGDRPELRGQSLFLDVNPDRDAVPGWLGHLCARGTKENANCVAVPLQGAAPLCIVVATCDIPEGEKICRDIASNEGEFLLRDRITQSGDIALNKYASQIAELKTFTDMAYQNHIQGPTEEIAEEGLTNKDEAMALKCFKKINLDYPGLQEFNRDPDIYAVDDFLTAEECDRVIAKCKPHMKPCVTKDAATGVVGPDERRTSTEAMLPRAEAPTIVSKLVSLLDCKEDQLEILQVLRYEKGQEFKEHTDGFSFPVTAAGFENSGRLVTVFTYLNNVRRGGHTNFPELSFSVAPKKGSAIIHFPATEALEEDRRTLHQGMPAVDEKWLLTTWVWQHMRTDERYAESNLKKLSDDVI